jgi:pimeloyl-ACP methyl ester carboxylesterase
VRAAVRIVWGMQALTNDMNGSIDNTASANGARRDSGANRGLGALGTRSGGALGALGTRGTRGALAVLALALAAPALPGCAADAEDAAEGSTVASALRADGALARDVLLVHGAWADGSSWSGVIGRLQHDGYTVRAVQLPLQSLADDAAIVRREIERIGRPVVVAGHSYGGAVITEAASGASNVTGLVYAAAYSLDQGESLLALNKKFSATEILGALEFDALGNATVEPEAFTRLFAPDLPPRQARVLAATQKPISGAIFGTPGGAPAWRDIPAWYQVSTADQVINPDLQRFVAARMNAHVVELPASHASPVSQPNAIAELIETAAYGQ